MTSPTPLAEFDTWEAVTRSEYVGPVAPPPTARGTRTQGLTIDHDRPAWFTRAACRGVGPDPFFSYADEPSDEALSFCNGCSVKAECKAFGQNQPCGIWGGENRGQRKPRGFAACLSLISTAWTPRREVIHALAENSRGKDPIHSSTQRITQLIAKGLVEQEKHGEVSMVRRAS